MNQSPADRRDQLRQTAVPPRSDCDSAFSPDRYSMLYDLAPVGYLSLNSEGIILQGNSAAAKLLGLEWSDLIGRAFGLLLQGKSRPVFASFLEQAFTRGAVGSACQVKLGDDSTFAQLQCGLDRSGSTCLMTITDVSTLCREAEKFHIVAHNTYAWEFWLGPDGRFRYLSPSCKRITGYDAAAFEDDPKLFFRIVHPQDRPPFNPADLELYTPVTVNHEYRIRHKDGSIRWIRHDGQIVLADDGTILGLRGSNRDITPERELREQLVCSVDELKKLTAELNLSEERERRRIALALHDQVVQGLALGKLNLEAALTRGEIGAHPVFQELRTLLDSAMQQLRDLCFDLSSPILYDLGLESAISHLGEKLEKRFGFRFVFKPLHGQRLQLEENLAVAMFQFCREFLMNTGKHAAASTVTVMLYQDQDRLLLITDDDGRGFDTEDTKEGFGLANIRQRVNYLGGTFTLTSRPGAGTRSVVSLNLAALSGRERALWL